MSQGKIDGFLSQCKQRGPSGDPYDHLTECKKESVEIQLPFIIRTLSKLEIQEDLLNLTTDIYKKYYT